MTFKDIKGYEGIYQVSEDGVVKSLANQAKRKEKILKIHVRDGYPSVELWTNGMKKKKMVHRLVAETFLSNPTDLPQVNHKDEDTKNPKLANLEWCTQKENITYSARLRAIERLISKFNITREELDVLLPAPDPN